MSKPKYEILNIATGKLEEMDLSPEDFFEEMASKIAEESSRLYDLYKAEREIVQSIIEKAIDSTKESIRSTD